MSHTSVTLIVRNYICWVITTIYDVGVIYAGVYNMDGLHWLAYVQISEKLMANDSTVHITKKDAR